jgi:hypothetical protein
MGSTMTLAQLREGIDKLHPVSEEELIISIRKILGGSLIEDIKTHNTRSILFIFDINKDKYLIKTEFSNGENTVTQELAWYQRISYDYPEKLTYIAGESLDNWSYILMDYIQDAITLEYWMTSGDVSFREAYGPISEALKWEEQVYKNFPKKKVDKLHVLKFFDEKYVNRINQAHKYDYLSKLLEQPEVIVNGKSYKNITFSWNKLMSSKDFWGYMDIKYFGQIHGDLHLNNILIQNQRIYLIDPNGKQYLPLEYDYGKLMQSLHGGYGSIMSKHYKLEQKSCNNFELKIDNTIQKTFLPILQESLTNKLYVRSLFFEAFHFTTMLAHHAPEETETITLFLQAVVLLDELQHNIVL